MNMAFHDVLARAGTGELAELIRETDRTVLAIGADVAEIGQQVSSLISPEARFLGLSGDPEVVRAARAAGLPERFAFAELLGDLRMNREAVDARLAAQPVRDFQGLGELDAELRRMSEEQPLVVSATVDLAVVEGLFGLGSHDARAAMLKELHRVIRKGGRLVLADVVSDESVLPSVLYGVEGLDGGAVDREDRLLANLAKAGFYGITLRYREEGAWRVVDGVELRRVVVVAWKGKEGACWEHNQAVLYKGPFSKVEDDDGHVYERGVATAVCEKTFNLIANRPYADHFLFIEPAVPVAPEAVKPFPCNLTSPVRDPRQIKQGRYHDPDAVAPTPAPAAAPAPAPVEAAAPDPSRKQLTIFGRGATTAGELVALVNDRYSQHVQVTVVDLDTAGPDVTMPGQLRFRLQLLGDACLPAVVLDRVLVSIGKLPDAAEVERLITEGRGFGSLEVPKVASEGACGPAGCC